MSRRPGLLLIMIILMQSNLMSKSAFGMMTLSPSLAVSERYHSNVEASSTDEEASEDYETSINPQIALLNEWEGLSITGNYSLNSRLYAKDADRNYVGHTFSLAMDKELTRNISMFFSDSYIYTKDSREALENQMELGRGTVITNSAALSLAYTISERASSGIGISQSTTLYDNEELFDDRTDGLSLTYSNRMSRYLTLDFSYAYTVFNYENDSHVDDREIHNMSLGITRMLTRSLTFTLTAGVNYMPDMESDYDWTGNGGLSKSWRRTSLDLAYTRAVTNSGGLVAEVVINDRGSLLWHINRARTVTWSLEGSYSKSRSKDTDVIDNYSYSYGLNCSWQRGEWTMLNLGVTRFEQKTDDLLTREVESNALFLSIAFTPEGWRL